MPYKIALTLGFKNYCLTIYAELDFKCNPNRLNNFKTSDNCLDTVFTKSIINKFHRLISLTTDLSQLATNNNYLLSLRFVQS